MLHKISVIIPTKDRVLYLRQAVNSVLNQTYPVYEILIVNDGSNKNIDSQIDDIKTLSTKIVIFKIAESRGTSFARNLALNNVKGDFIIFLDDDDLIHPRMIESSLLLLDEEIDVVSSPFTYFFSEEKNSGQLITNIGGNSGKEMMRFIKPVNNIVQCKNLELRPFYEILRNSFPIHTSIIRKRCLANVRFQEDLQLGEDTYFWLTLAHQGCSFRFNKEVDAFYRLHNSNHIRRLKDTNQSSLKYLFKLKSSGMLQEKEDLFFVHSQIFINLFRLRDITSIKYLFYLQKSPKLFVYLLIKTFRSKILNHDDVIYKQITPYLIKFL